MFTKLLAVLFTLALVAGARAQDSVAPTCEIVRSSITASPAVSGWFRFTFNIDAADNVALKPYNFPQAPLEFRARVNGGNFGPWSPWPLDYDQPIYIDVDCFEFHFQVRSVDQAGNRSARAAKDFFAPFALQKNTTKATFGVARNFTTGGTTAAALIAGADFDSDGHPDFAQGDHNSGIVTIRRNAEGKGKTFIPVQLAFPANSVDDLASGKLAAPTGTGANDLLPDLVVASNSNLVVQINQGLDLGGTLTFTAQTPLTTADHYLQYVAVADLNNDGFADIAATASPFAGAADPAHKVAIFLNNGTPGSFAAPVLYNYGTFARDIALGDFNGDTIPDIAVADLAGVKVLINNGTGTFGTAIDAFTAYAPHRLALADVTGDGRVDIIAATQTTFAIGGPNLRHIFNIEIIRNKPNGTFTPAYGKGIASLDLTTQFTYDCGLAVADVNGDGKLDIVAGSELSKTVTILHLQALKNSDGDFLTFLNRGKSTALSGGKIRALALADLDGKRGPDIILTNTSATNQTSILLNATP